MRTAVSNADPVPVVSLPMSHPRDIGFAPPIASVAQPATVERTTPVTFGDGSTGVKVSVGRGNTLPIAVHPSFAGYATREVWIRVTARTTEPIRPGVNCGMNLWYQSTSGSSKGAPPYPYTNAKVWWTVPPDQKWHSKVWRLSDIMFVNTFGFSLYLQFDASPTFVVGKVEISKVPSSEDGRRARRGGPSRGPSARTAQLSTPRALCA